MWYLLKSGWFFGFLQIFVLQVNKLTGQLARTEQQAQQATVKKNREGGHSCRGPWGWRLLGWRPSLVGVETIDRYCS